MIVFIELEYKIFLSKETKLNTKYLVHSTINKQWQIPQTSKTD